MVTLYNVTSADGFIARNDGSEDFIPDELWDEHIKHSKENDAVVWGRNTYEKAQGYGEELMGPFEELPIQRIVLTRDTNFKAKTGYTVMHSPEEAVAANPNTLISTGPVLTGIFLKKGLIDRVITTVLPEAIGEGIKQFDFDTTDLLVLESEEVRPGGEKVKIYKVSK